MNRLVLSELASSIKINFFLPLSSSLAGNTPVLEKLPLFARRNPPLSWKPHPSTTSLEPPPPLEKLPFFAYQNTPTGLPGTPAHTPRRKSQTPTSCCCCWGFSAVAGGKPPLLPVTPTGTPTLEKVFPFCSTLSSFLLDLFIF